MPRRAPLRADSSPVLLYSSRREQLPFLFLVLVQVSDQSLGAVLDRRHLLTENCSDVHLRVCCCRTGNEDCCCSIGSPRQKITGIIFALFGWQIDSTCRYSSGYCSSFGCSSGYCSSSRQVLEQKVLLLLLELRASQRREEGCLSTSRDGSHRSRPLVEQNWVGSGYVCLMVQKQLPHAIQKEQTKTNYTTKKKHFNAYAYTF